MLRRGLVIRPAPALSRVSDSSISVEKHRATAQIGHPNPQSPIAVLRIMDNIEITRSPSERKISAALAYAAAEAAASVATSASSKDCLEDIGIVAIVVAELKFGEVQRQIGLAYIVIRADDSALEQAPERFQIVGMDLAAHILVRLVVNVLMRKRLMELLIASRFIGRNQADIGRYGLAHKLRHGFGGGVFDDLAHHVSFARDRADDRGLARRAASLSAFCSSADCDSSRRHRFRRLRLGPSASEVLILHRGADALEHIPRRSIVAATNLPMNLQSADALLALAHQIDDFKPSGERIIRVLENRFGDDAEAIAVASAAFFGLANPVEGPRLERVDLIAITARTAHAIGPAHITEQGFAGVLARKIPLQFGERDVRLCGERFASGNFVVHEEKYSNYGHGCQA